MAASSGNAPESAYKALSRALGRLAGQVEPPACSIGVSASVALPDGGRLSVEVTGPGYRVEARESYIGRDYRDADGCLFSPLWFY